MYQAIAIFVILLGVVITSIDFKEVKSGKFLKDKGTLLAIMVMVGWGIYWTFIKIPIQEIGWFWTGYIVDIMGVISLGIIGLKGKEVLKKVDKRSMINLFTANALLTMGTFSFYYALSIGKTAIVAPIAGSYTTLYVLLSRFAFKDRLSTQQWVGIVTTLVGIVILAFLS